MSGWAELKNSTEKSRWSLRSLAFRGASAVGLDTLVLECHTPKTDSAVSKEAVWRVKNLIARKRRMVLKFIKTISFAKSVKSLLFVARDIVEPFALIVPAGISRSMLGWNLRFNRL